MAIEIVDLPINSMVIVHSFWYVYRGSWRNPKQKVHPKTCFFGYTLDHRGSRHAIISDSKPSASTSGVRQLQESCFLFSTGKVWPTSSETHDSTWLNLNVRMKMSRITYRRNCDPHDYRGRYLGQALERLMRLVVRPGWGWGAQATDATLTVRFVLSWISIRDSYMC